jgi:hypothetical protein
MITIQVVGGDIEVTGDIERTIPAVDGAALAIGDGTVLTLTEEVDVWRLDVTVEGRAEVSTVSADPEAPEPTFTDVVTVVGDCLWLVPVAPADVTFSTAERSDLHAGLEMLKVGVLNIHNACTVEVPGADLHDMPYRSCTVLPCEPNRTFRASIAQAEALVAGGGDA